MKAVVEVKKQKQYATLTYNNVFYLLVLGVSSSIPSPGWARGWLRENDPIPILSRLGKHW